MLHRIVLSGFSWVLGVAFGGGDRKMEAYAAGCSWIRENPAAFKEDLWCGRFLTKPATAKLLPCHRYLRHSRYIGRKWRKGKWLNW